MQNILDLRSNKKVDTLGSSLNKFIKENYHLLDKKVKK